MADEGMLKKFLYAFLIVLVAVSFGAFVVAVVMLVRMGKYGYMPKVGHSKPVHYSTLVVLLSGGLNLGATIATILCLKYKKIGLVLMFSLFTSIFVCAMVSASSVVYVLKDAYGNYVVGALTVSMIADPNKLSELQKEFNCGPKPKSDFGMFGGGRYPEEGPPYKPPDEKRVLTFKKALQDDYPNNGDDKRTNNSGESGKELMVKCIDLVLKMFQLMMDVIFGLCVFQSLVEIIVTGLLYFYIRKGEGEA